ncbi:hypothetical protein LZB72_09385, partial [Campylobacter jejuni]
CAMFIHYINSRLLSCVLIIDKKEIIDLSGFGLYLGSDESNIASNLAYKITLSEEIKSIENIFSEIFLNSEQKDKGYKIHPMIQNRAIYPLSFQRKNYLICI